MRFEPPPPGASIDDLVSAIAAAHTCSDDRFDQLERKIESDREATHALIARDRHADRNAQAALEGRVIKNERTLVSLNKSVIELGKLKRETAAQLTAVNAQLADVQRSLGAGKPLKAPLNLGNFVAYSGLILIGYKALWAAAPYLWHAVITAANALAH